MSHRTQITLTDAQYERLLDESRRSGLGLAELVRRALERIYGAPPHDKVLSALDASFAAWEDRSMDGASYVEAMRRGMSERLAGQ